MPNNNQTGLNAFTTPDTQQSTDRDTTSPEALLQPLLNRSHNPENTEHQDATQLTEYTDSIEAKLEHVTAQGHSRSRVFTDWINMILAALQHDDDSYETITSRYTEQSRFDPEDTRHPVAQLSAAFGEVTAATDETGRDVLGHIYMSFGEPSDTLGQNFTPEPVADLMAQSTLTDDDLTGDKDQDGPVPGLRGVSVADPACGSGRLLLSMARQLRERDVESFWVHGCDLDPICAKMSAVNLYLHGIDGVIVHGDALTMDSHAAWLVRHDRETGSTITSAPPETLDDAQ